MPPRAARSKTPGTNGPEKAGAKAAPKKAAATTKAAPAKAAPKKAAAKATPAAKDTKTKKAAPKKANTMRLPSREKSTPAPEPPKKANGKRKAESEDESEQAPAKRSKREPTPRAKREPTPRAKREATPKVPKATKPAKPKPAPAPPVAINDVPHDRLDIFVFGEGTAGELGLGSVKYDGSKKPIDVKRPRINHNLDAKTVGVVMIATGGMHSVALTHDNKVLTWGVNDDKALGRDTTWSGGVVDMDEAEDSDSDSDDSGMNPRESTPGEVDLSALHEEDKVAMVGATDSASWILTASGLVYGWGTFRGSDGIIGFRPDIKHQDTPMLIPELKKIKTIATGSNHVLALNDVGKIFTWGSGGQYQLGRKAISRHGGQTAGLTPEPCGSFRGKRSAIAIAAGSYHSFYVDNRGDVYSWGLNNFSQTGLHEHSGEDDAMVLQPTLVRSLSDLQVKQIAGGEHHSLACTDDGQLLTWGRVDGHQVGHPDSLYNEDNSVYDENKKPRILIEPTAIKNVKASFVAAGTDTSFAIDDEGKIYSWGFSANYQTGQGTDEEIEEPTEINNTAIRGRKIVYAGGGGQFSIIAARAETQTNGANGH